MLDEGFHRTSGLAREVRRTGIRGAEVVEREGRGIPRDKGTRLRGGSIQRLPLSGHEDGSRRDAGSQGERGYGKERAAGWGAVILHY